MSDEQKPKSSHMILMEANTRRREERKTKVLTARNKLEVALFASLSVPGSGLPHDERVRALMDAIEGYIDIKVEHAIERDRKGRIRR